MATKRKRNSLATPSSTDDNATPENDVRNHGGDGEESSALLPVVTSESPFQVQILRSLESKPKKRRLGNKKEQVDWSAHKEEPALWQDGMVAYTVSPGSLWDDMGRMKKYRNFEVNETTFSVHDFVYVNHSEKGTGETIDDDENHFWVAKVLEVRAEGPHAVYLRVFWMYFPEELPDGRQYFHGKLELVASNHMEIIDAQTVSEKVGVTHVSETDEAPTVNGLYWRQYLDVSNNKISSLRRHCKCKKYHNPDKLLIRCSDSKCGKWMHEGCIIEDIKEKVWNRLNSAAPEVITDAKEEGQDLADTVKLTPKNESQEVIRVGQLDNHTLTASKVPKPKPKKRKGRRASKVVDSMPWDGILEGKLVMRSLPSETGAGAGAGAEDEETAADFAGKTIVTDTRDGNTFEEIASCLFCRNTLEKGQDEE